MKKWHKDHSNITEALQICNIFVTNSKHLEKNVKICYYKYSCM